MPSLTIKTILSAAAAAGLVGSFALMRRMTLAADSMSHVALPGLAIAALFKINPLIGGFTALVVGAIIIWGVEQRTKIATESIIGVVFSASLAIGALLSTPEELLDILFGNFTSLTLTQGLIGLAASLGVIVAILFLKERLALSILSPDIAATLKLNNSRLSLIYLLIFAVNIILGLKFLGILLMGSLIIIPAATAKNLARSFNSDLWLSSLISITCVGLGLIIASFYKLALGPVIIAVAAAFFFISIFFARNK